MNVAEFRLAHEKFAITAVSNYLNVPEKLIDHESKKKVTSDYDFGLKGIRFDVKYSHPTKPGVNKIPVWDFSLRKMENGKRVGAIRKHCDFYVLIGMKNGIPLKVFLVPFNEAPTNHIRISINGVSKYHKYLI